jgi:hypothetical protein
MKAIILGNSQAQGAGTKLESELKRIGYSVTRLAKHGAKNKDLISLYKTKSHPDYDLAVVFSGDPSGVSDVCSLFETVPYFVWYGPPPATKILDVSYARKVFGSKVTGSDYWFDSGHAAQRDKDAESIRKSVKGKATFIDFKEIDGVGGELQKSGVVFPSMKDGIHIDSAYYARMFNAPNFPNNAVSSRSSESSRVLIALSLSAAVAVAAIVIAARRGKFEPQMLPAN